MRISRTFISISNRCFSSRTGSFLDDGTAQNTLNHTSRSPKRTYVRAVPTVRTYRNEARQMHRDWKSQVSHPKGNSRVLTMKEGEINKGQQDINESTAQRETKEEEEDKKNHWHSQKQCKQCENLVSTVASPQQSFSRSCQISRAQKTIKMKKKTEHMPLSIVCGRQTKPPHRAVCLTRRAEKKKHNQTRSSTTGFGKNTLAEAEEEMRSHTGWDR